MQTFPTPPQYLMPQLTKLPWDFTVLVWAQETRVMDLPGDRKSLTICIFQQTISILQTERQTLCVLAHADVR